MPDSHHPPPRPPAPPRRPFWRSPSLLAGGALTLLGGLLWLRAPAPLPVAATPASSVGSSFAVSRAAPAPSLPPSDRPFIGKESPFAFRLGAGYLGGFLVGWVWRKSVKAALSFGAAALALVATAKQFGIGGADLQALQAEVTGGVNWLQQQAGALKEWLSGYMPSGVASVLGIWRGARWK